ncbi:hypothetical protein SAMN04488026_10429 [Aliiruegeria lutimaris]|uniref:Uncharacterized protein n=1 Tax=Aliiruegeria lutimaris TaxID=571298 RepID=A0A1G9C4P7_9RHOB|nr:hypothetical protein SAMN04488026_10429 [Aliiruegeria lutimaris]
MRWEQQNYKISVCQGAYGLNRQVAVMYCANDAALRR